MVKYLHRCKSNPYGFPYYPIYTIGNIYNTKQRTTSDYTVIKNIFIGGNFFSNFVKFFPKYLSYLFMKNLESMPWLET